MSVPDLIAHEERYELMSMAFTYRRGVNDGEYLKQTYPEYHRQIKEAQERVQRARGG